MGSVVLDAVNSSFFHHQQHPFQDAPSARDAAFSSASRPSSTSYRSASPPPRSETSMSTSAPRASSSSTAHTTPQSAPAPTENVARRASQQLQQQSQTASSSRTPSARPPSPPLAPSTGPPLDGTQSSATAVMDDAPPEIRRNGPPKIKVRDLEHIQAFASEDMNAFSEIRSRSRSRSRGAETPQYEISEMKVEHIIEMVAGLLTKITTTNDQQHEHLHRQPPHLQTTQASALSPQTTSVLAFHGKNVPSITILSYLSRINKYCPTSYEVFLSLLVYFDRMTERVNAGPMQSLRQANEAAAASASAGTSAAAAAEQHRHQSISSTHSSNSSSSSGSSATSEDMEGVTATTPQGTQTATPPASGNMQKADEGPGRPGTPHSRTYHQPDSPPQPQPQTQTIVPPSLMTDPYNLSHFFVVDSFNIHRLVIAGVTCASKFFSDIFYTNSRYAKVGGLPLPELNHLELQFLLLNDFRLSIPVEEIEAYGTMLVEFYAREVVAQQRAVAEAERAQAQAAAAAGGGGSASSMQARSLSESSEDSVATVRAA